MKKVCEVCKEDFDVRPSRAEFRHTCSRKCKGLKMSEGKSEKKKCHVCKKDVIKTLSKINSSKSGYVFCSNSCVGKFNSQNNIQGIKKNCLICEKEFTTTKSRQDTHIVCSLPCHSKWQSKYRTGENPGNFRNSGGTKECKNCEKEFSVQNASLMKTKMYCSMDCKRVYWKKNILHNDKFKIAHYEGNLKYRMSNKSETTPEKLVREFLESKGLVKDIDFIQEKGFFRKYYADFFIPKTMTIIEVHGDYWHGNPDVYGDGDSLKSLYDSQIERIKKDEQKKLDFIKYGFNYHIVWEKDIHEDINKTMKEVMNIVFPRNDYTQNI